MSLFRFLDVLATVHILPAAVWEATVDILARNVALTTTSQN